ncbi:general transcription factor 3C polypeptide 5 [Phlebotomus papatasi]|uniref:general transcription factor 3C polypeptide 5 n=1 Tax=Phlebotomus papatasi TaxID=29031 RepID=UPI002483489E|nr:general transcription factor 3C polypeptide 5 [Phlebotomus papatasi]
MDDSNSGNSDESARGAAALESTVKKKTILVEYPGLVNNVDKCLRTLGGIGKLSETFGNEKKRLELKFTPENLYSKPVFADEHGTMGLLLKIKLPRRPLVNTVEVPSDRVEIVAKIESCYRFSGLCDFQLLPIVKRESGRVEMIYKELIPTYKDGYSWLTENPNVPYFLPPLLFSRMDTVQHKIFRPTYITEKGTVTPKFQQRKKRSRYNIFASFNLHDPFPDKMNPAAAEMLKIKFISTEEFNVVKGLFEERAIWSRMALCYVSNVSMSRLRVILPTLGFFFNSGPWRGLWCKFGYDPRKHFDSRHYQVLDYRLRNQVGARYYVSRKSSHVIGAVNKASVNKKTLRPKTEEEKDAETQIYSPYFEEGKMPGARQVNYQYCDIRVAKIQEMLEKLPGPLHGTTCTERTGWLPPGFEMQCREIMNELLREHFQAEILKREEMSGDEEMSSAEEEEDSTLDETFEEMDIDEEDNK